MTYLFSGLLVGVSNVLAYFLESRLHFLETQLLPALGLNFSGVSGPLLAVVLVTLLLIGIGLLASARSLVVMPVILGAALLTLLAPALGFNAQAFYGVTMPMATIAIFSVIGAFVLMEQGSLLHIHKGRAFARLKLVVAIAAANAGTYYYYTLFAKEPLMGLALCLITYGFAGLILGLIAADADAIEATVNARKALADQAEALQGQVTNYAAANAKWEKSYAAMKTERDTANGQIIEKDQVIKDLKVRLGDEAPEAPVPALRVASRGGFDGGSQI